MPEYINKTKLLEQLNSELSEISTAHHDHIDLEKQMYEFAIKKVKEMDSIKIVRCATCKYYLGKYCTLTDDTEDRREPDDFCSYGERRLKNE